MREIWEPFVEADDFRQDPTSRLIAAMAQSKSPDKIYINNIYQVAVFNGEGAFPGWPAMIHLSIKRRDKKPIHDWRHLQRIKNELVGKDYEAIEIYPAEERLVDTANQYHLWVFSDPTVRIPCGFPVRFVSNRSEGGAVQRPFPLDAMPTDCESAADFLKRIRSNDRHGSDSHGNTDSGGFSGVLAKDVQHP